jgi:hypothetical protein
MPFFSASLVAALTSFGQLRFHRLVLLGRPFAERDEMPLQAATGSPSGHSSRSCAER